MIDVEKVKREFDKYAHAYDGEHPKVKLKIRHTHRVAKLAGEIAKSLKMDEENIRLAITIGYLHDLGRFEQIKRYNSFNDLMTVDHADYSDMVLFEEGLIRKFISEAKYDDIIEAAVRNHNKKFIDKHVEGIALEHAKIIRDADKADILWVYCHENLDVIFEINALKADETISDKVMSDFLKYKLVDKHDIKTDPDLIVLTMSFMYDANTKYFLKYIYDHQFANKLLNRIKLHNNKIKDQINEVKTHINRYLIEHLA